MKIKSNNPKPATYTLKVNEVELRELSFALYILTKEHYDSDLDRDLKELAEGLHTTINEAINPLGKTNG